MKSSTTIISCFVPQATAAGALFRHACRRARSATCKGTHLGCRAYGRVHSPASRLIPPSPDDLLFAASPLHLRLSSEKGNRVKGLRIGDSRSDDNQKDSCGCGAASATLSAKLIDKDTSSSIDGMIDTARTDMQRGARIKQHVLACDGSRNF
jgi:hypothetical protein